MIVSQTTTIVFEYPHDYLQEQEWLKEKAEQWVHIGTDTQCAIYEHQCSYRVGADIRGADDEFEAKD